MDHGAAQTVLTCNQCRRSFRAYTRGCTPHMCPICQEASRALRPSSRDGISARLRELRSPS